MNNFRLKVYLLILLCTVLIITIICIQLSYKSNRLTGDFIVPTPTPTLQPRNRQACIQVITPAKDPRTGKCQQFSTPCDIPNNWQKVSSCTN